MIDWPHGNHTESPGTFGPGWDPVLDLIDPNRSTGTAALIAADPGMGRSVLLQAAMHRARSEGYFVVTPAMCPAERYRTGANGHMHDDGPDQSAADVSEWLSRASRKQPVLVAVDDADRLEPSAVDTLLRMIETLRAQPIVFLLTSRSSAAAGLIRPDLRLYELPPLDAPAAARLQRRQPSRLTGLAAYEVFRQAKGNPRAIVELCHAFGDREMPETLRIRTTYARQIGALPDATRNTLLYLAGRTGREPLAAVLSAAGRSSMHPEVWEPAVAAGLVELRDDDAVFPDPLVAVAVYHSAPAVERRRVHADFTDVIRQPSFERAMHQAMLPLGCDARTAAILEAESRKARDDGRMTHAAVAAQRAAELSTDRELAARRYVLATLAASAAGHTDWTRELAAHVDRLTEQPDLRCSAASATATALSRGGHQREAMALIVRTAGSHPFTDQATALGLAVCGAAVSAQSGLSVHRDAATSLLGAVAGRPVLPTSTPYLGAADLALQRASAAVSVDPACAPDHRKLLLAEHDQVARIPAMDRLALATIADALDDSEFAITLRSEVLDESRPGEGTAVFPEAWPALIRGLIDTGRWDAAERGLDSAAELAAARDLPVLRVHLAALRAVLAAFRGDAPTARSLAEEGWPGLCLESNRTGRVGLLRALGYAALAADDFDTASRDFLAAIEIQAHAGTMPPDGVDAIGLAMAAARAGTSAVALPVLDSVRQAHGTRPAILTQLQLTQAYALLADDTETERRFRYAISHPRAGSWPFLLALARLHYGSWLRRQRRPLDARRRLTEAFSAFGALGARVFARSACVELRAGGGDPDDRGKPADVAFLSAQQLQIARLAAQGLRNRDVADRLQLSPRTVSTHLHNVYLRLGITQRHQLRQVLPPEQPLV
ncbi:LuxR C-terminal-related transcriptional regulator [Pseudonocardia sp. CA-142604]|uniref:helix-turn-helix transcriptional regulator n=1 Tax=Pseudonocardia sp. CA-142604 TaxID=3240024 RepID=UPI003D93BC60